MVGVASWPRWACPTPQLGVAGGGIGMGERFAARRPLPPSGICSHRPGSAPSGPQPRERIHPVLTAIYKHHGDTENAGGENIYQSGSKR